MLLVIDNYDSFTYNLVQYLGELGAEIVVHRNDAITVDEISALAPSAMVLSPGPCAPAQAGITVEAIRALSNRIPTLGVCLGHQAIGEAYGGRVVRAARAVHGKTSRIAHDGSELFAGLPSPLEVGRYHSLVVERASLPAELQVVATSVDDPTEIHALRHATHPVWGVQFHPESVLTQNGKQLLRNFLDLVTA
ncbi:MAG: glutamine amidotransferase of anthranilate synthase [Gemmatimonadetes bacterium]|jgi:anthranilate synthase/aminodeoxychorismate synthase-like glutamine amidotransferase|nr:glutamine amidotransferase of anthranilate synthase [Gemmatimonadota bacterium]